MFIGTILNALGIFIGALLGLTLTRRMTQPTQLAWRSLMGVFTVFVGLRLSWLSFNGGFYQILKQVMIMLLSMSLGKIIGGRLHIQDGLNRLGRNAGERFSRARPEDPNRLNEGFMVCSMLFCAGPLGWLGSVTEGLTGHWEPLAIKMVMDGLAAVGFVSVFGWGVLLSAIPVLAFQSSLTVLVVRLEPFLRVHGLVDSINVIVGFLLFSVALIILEIRKVRLGDYLPSLIVAPLITWYWR